MIDQHVYHMIIKKSLFSVYNYPKGLGAPFCLWQCSYFLFKILVNCQMCAVCLKGFLDKNVTKFDQRRCSSQYSITT